MHQDRADKSHTDEESLRVGENVRELVAQSEIEILDLYVMAEEEEVEDALKRDIWCANSGQTKVTLRKKAFRRSLKAYVEIREELAARPIRTRHLKRRSVYFRVKKVQSIKCYRCQGYVHQAASCTGPDQRMSFWRCGVEGHPPVMCTS